MLGSGTTLVDNPEHLQHALRYWNIPFTAVGIISNRATPFHRDPFGRREWFDFLLGLGDYDDGRFEVGTLGLRLEYNPGCGLLFSGKLLRHGAYCPSPRACVAFYMRDNVQERMSPDVPLYTKIKDFAMWTPTNTDWDLEHQNMIL